MKNESSILLYLIKKLGYKVIFNEGILQYRLEPKKYKKTGNEIVCNSALSIKKIHTYWTKD